MTILIVDRDANLYRAALLKHWPDVQIHCAPTADAVTKDMETAEVLIGLSPYLGDALLSRLPHLKWIHALTTGVDNLLASPVLAAPNAVAITRSRGIHGPQMSELALLMMLGLLRNLPRMIDQARAGEWERWPQPLLAGKTLCVVGLGAIAEALVTRAAAFGMRSIGISDGRTQVPGFERIFPRNAITEAMRETDVLVVIVPYSAQTHHIINAEVIAALPRGAILINIARGGCVEETAVLAALQSGHLGGAGLDVFAVEPLPANSPFRTLPNVILTPHIGGMSDTYAAQVLPIIETNLRLYFEGGIAALPDKITPTTLGKPL